MHDFVLPTANESVKDGHSNIQTQRTLYFSQDLFVLEFEFALSFRSLILQPRNVFKAV